MSAGVLLVSLVCNCVYRGTACAPIVLYNTNAPPCIHDAGDAGDDPYYRYRVAQIHHLVDVGSSTLDICHRSVYSSAGGIAQRVYSTAACTTHSVWCRAAVMKVPRVRILLRSSRHHETIDQECWIPHPRDGGSVQLRICRMYHHPQHLHHGCTVLHWCCTIHWCIRGTTVHAVAYQRYQQHVRTHWCRP